MGSNHEDAVPPTGTSSPGEGGVRARPAAPPPPPAPRATTPRRAGPPAPSVDEGHFRLLAERSRDLVYRYRLLPDRGFEYVSPSATLFTGYTPAEHYADPDLGLTLVHPDDRHLLEEAAASRAPDPLVVRWIRRDGTVIWAEQHTFPVLDASGTLVAIEGSARDVTARERARQALEASERRLRTLLERVSVLAGSVDLDGRVTFLNPAFLRATGWTAEEATGADWFDTFVPAGSREARRAAFTAAGAGGSFDRDDVVEFLRRDGSVRRMRAHVMGVHDESGHLAGVAVIGADLTAIEEQETRTARLTAAIEQTADAVVITDPEGRIQYANPAFERVSGYRLADVRGENTRFLKSGRQSTAFYRRMWRTLASGAAWSGELINKRRDGSIFIEEATITPIHGGQGMITAYVAVKRDVTHLRELRESLDAAREHREEVVRAIADLAAGPTLEVTAERIASALLAIPGAETAGVILFENGKAARHVALATDLDLPIAVGDLIPPARASYLRERAAQGPWVETWRARPEDGDYGRAITAAGIRAILYVPVRNNGAGPLGVLTVSVTRPDAARKLANQLPSAIEVAAVARTLLEPMALARVATQEARSRISAVIAERAFRPVFQPVVDLTTGLPVGFEALTRFADGVRPDLVFAEARVAGVGVELEIATLEAALDGAATLPPYTWLSLNVSPALVLDNGRLRGVLARRSRPVILEITEHEQVNDYGALRSALVGLGPDVLVAVDDAGAGIANFGHLVELRPDFVKLDIGLVRDVNADASRQAMVAGMRHFAEVSNSRVVAEGVETEAERETLERLGIHYGQGYLFGRPAEAATWASPPTAGADSALASGRRRRARGAT